MSRASEILCLAVQIVLVSSVVMACSPGDNSTVGVSTEAVISNREDKITQFSLAIQEINSLDNLALRENEEQRGGGADSNNKDGPFGIMVNRIKGSELEVKALKIMEKHGWPSMDSFAAFGNRYTLFLIALETEKLREELLAKLSNSASANHGQTQFTVYGESEINTLLNTLPESDVYDEIKNPLIRAETERFRQLMKGLDR